MDKESCQVVFEDLHLAEDFERFLSEDLKYNTDILAISTITDFESAITRFEMQTGSTLGG